MTTLREQRGRTPWLIGLAVVILIAVGITLLAVYGGGGSAGY
jgi:hypothetical protein